MDKLKILFISLISVFEKFKLILSTTKGWVALTTSSLLTFLLPVKTSLLILFIFVILDLVFGIMKSVKNKKSITSSGLFNTIAKLFVYTVLISTVYSIEGIASLEIFYKITFAACALVELYSIITNLTEVFPNVPILKIFNKLLIKELENKTNIKDIDKYLKVDSIKNEQEVDNKSE